MIESHASALEVIASLHQRGATHVKVTDDSVEVKFDRIFVPLNSVQSTEVSDDAEPTENRIDVRLDGDVVSMSASEVQLMRDELEVLRDMRRSVEALGVL